jgi:hypothetical protein
MLTRRSPPAQTGDECTGGVACCDDAAALPAAHCEPVNEYFSKCVMQPKCAKANAQCKGKGQSVMEATPCCTAGFVCNATNEWYSSCVNASAPAPAPPAPPSPEPTCGATGGQCDGKDPFKAIPCCDKSSKCELVNEFYSKCVAQPTCAKEDKQCSGTGDHPMEATACCNADDTCVPWGTEWSVCRSKGHETCAVHEEQCAGTGASAMKQKSCCDPAETCVKVNEYYSKCDSKPPALVSYASCPGLGGCQYGANGPSGKYAGSREIMEHHTNATLNFVDGSHVDIVVSGEPGTSTCKGEAYAFDGSSTITLPNAATAGDCAHDAGQKGNTQITNIAYDSVADTITVTVVIQTFETLSYGLKKVKA